VWSNIQIIVCGRNLFLVAYYSETVIPHLKVQCVTLLVTEMQYDIHSFQWCIKNLAYLKKHNVFYYLRMR